MTRSNRIVLATVMGLGMLLVSGSRVSASDPTIPGKRLYLKYCSACHGSEGRGDGVVSGQMTPHPSDLTRLAQKHGGQFPFYQTLQMIDGRQTIRGHGDPDMPVWGEIFTADGDASPDTQAMVRGKLMLITEYLEAIQQGAGKN